MDTSKAPVVRAHLGKAFSRVIADSPHAFEDERLRTMQDRGLYVVERPSQLVYDDPEARFIAPEGRYVWLSVAAGQIMEITAGITERALPLEEAYKRASRIDKSLSSLPFEDCKPMKVGLAEVQWEMNQATTDGYELALTRCVRKNVQWTLRLSWLGSSAPSPEEAYVLSMRWSSEAIEDELLGKVLDKRLEHGDENKALPLSVWMRDP